MSHQQSPVGDDTSSSLQDHKRKRCRENIQKISAASRLLAARISGIIRVHGGRTAVTGIRRLDSEFAAVHTLLSEVQELCRLRLERTALLDSTVANLAMTLFARTEPVRKEIDKYLLMCEWVRGTVGDAAATVAMRAILFLLATSSSMKTLESSLQSIVLELQR